MNKYYTYLENIEERNKHSLKKEINLYETHVLSKKSILQCLGYQLKHI